MNGEYTDIILSPKYCILSLKMETPVDTYLVSSFRICKILERFGNPWSENYITNCTLRGGVQEKYSQDVKDSGERWENKGEVFNVHIRSSMHSVS